MIDGLERDRAEFATIGSDYAFAVDSWLAARFVAGIVALAVEVSSRSRRDLAHRSASDCSRLLRARCNWSAQSNRASLRRDYRTLAAVFIPGTSDRFNPLQSAVRSSALYGRNPGG